MHAARVTTTSTVSDRNVPSDRRATATSFCEVASRMRVDARTRAARGPKTKRTTSRSGLRSLNTATDSTRARASSTDTVIGTVLPLSTSAATSSRTPPAVAGAPPVKAAIAPASVSGAAAARHVKATAASPAPICSTCRRSFIADHAA